MKKKNLWGRGLTKAEKHCSSDLHVKYWLFLTDFN